MERNWLIVSSTPVAKTDSDAKKLFLIYNRATLEHLYTIKVKTSVFGANIRDANIFGGLLLGNYLTFKCFFNKFINIFAVMHGNNSIKFYSIDQVIKDHNYNDLCQVTTGEKHATRSAPECLYTVKSHHHHLEMNTNPWLYIRAQSDTMYSLHHMGDHSPVPNQNGN